MYYLSIHDLNGVCTARLADFKRLDFSAEVNGTGSLIFSVDAGHPARDALHDLACVRLYRRDPRAEIPWQMEGNTLLLAHRWESQPGAGATLTCSALHPNWLLSTRVVDWKSATSGRSLFNDLPAETIAKLLVRYNASVEANESEGRERDGSHTLLPIKVEADGGHGRILDWSCAYQDLLSTLQRLAAVGGGDFELLPAPEGGLEFCWFDGQRGSDRRRMVYFSLPLGNMAHPIYTLDSRTEKTVAVVCGRGEGLLRPQVHVNGDSYSSENDREGFLAANVALTLPGLQATGQRYLAEHPAALTLDFDVLQIPSALYGKHYFLGDLVSVRNPFTGTDETFKVQAVRIRLDQTTQSQGNPENIQVRLVPAGAPGHPAGDPESILIDLDWYTADNGESSVLEGGTFPDASACFSLDGGTFRQHYLSGGVSGGSFPL